MKIQDEDGTSHATAAGRPVTQADDSSRTAHLAATRLQKLFQRKNNPRTRKHYARFDEEDGGGDSIPRGEAPHTTNVTTELAEPDWRRRADGAERAEILSAYANGDGHHSCMENVVSPGQLEKVAGTEPAQASRPSPLCKSTRCVIGVVLGSLAGTGAALVDVIVKLSIRALALEHACHSAPHARRCCGGRGRLRLPTVRLTVQSGLVSWVGGRLVSAAAAEYEGATGGETQSGESKRGTHDEQHWLWRRG
mmetsp:Transcript_9009/g.15303  ORF Transcript_9009/g.15303 Transcript_9009/m.15303 type:complete len:251 (+) Transcript_9009:157-909(+)